MTTEQVRSGQFRTWALPCVLAILALLVVSGCGRGNKEMLPDGRIAETVEITNGTETLSGTLTLPTGTGPHSAVILISGSGPQDRDGGMRVLPGYKPFKEISDALSAGGMAVLRYDDRGYMKSSGNYLKADEEDFISDAQAALDYLLKRKDINTRKIGLAGHSEGAMIAAQIAGRNPKVAFVISLAGPATDGRSLLLKQTERINAAEGMTGEELEHTIESQEQIFDMVAAGEWDRLQNLIEDVTLASLESMPTERTAQMGDLGVLAKKKADQSIQAFQHSRYQYLLNHDNSADWKKVKVPILAIFGELDVQCDAGQNSTALKKACFESGNTNFDIVIIPGMNHLFLKAKTGSPSEYENLPKEIIPELTDKLVLWLKDQHIL